MALDYTTAKAAVGVILTLGLYSVLYKENKFYRTVEHIFVGFASGWALVTVWTDTLSQLWYDKMVGVTDDKTHLIQQWAYWPYAILLPFGLMGYFVFSKKHNWISRIPIGIILGLYSGQQIQAWSTQYGPQIRDSMKPLIPTVWKPITVPADVPNTGGDVYLSQVIGNWVFVITLLSVLSYFLFSFKTENNARMGRFNRLGRWLLMVGFGAMFGSTVMMRFSLLIDRINFIAVDFFKLLSGG